MRIVRVFGYAARLLVAVTMGLAVVGSLPTTARADDTMPVDLELGGEGATSWNITGIKPTDGGVKIVELHNVGSKDGFITIWVSDIISSEGENPESETGDVTEPGEITNYLLLDVTADSLNSNANLPTTINNLPQSVSWPEFIEIIPLEAGGTIILQWEWELPAETGNDAQGDGISFTINYLLREFAITDVSDVTEEVVSADNVTVESVFTDNVTVESEGGNGELTIEEDTTAQTEEGESLDAIWLIEIEKESSTPTETTATVGAHYDAGPHGTTFDQPLILTLTYSPDDIPERASEEDLVIVLWDEDAGEWVELEGCTVDTANKTVSAPVNHFSRYSIIAYVPPPPPPPPPSRIYPSPGPIKEKEEPSPPTDEEAEGEPHPPANFLEIDMLGKTGRVEIEADGTLRESLTLTDPGGNFVIDIDRGTKVTGSNNMELSRLELTITEESIVVADDIAVLSPIYRLTGYSGDMEVSRINFAPSARLTISYDPGNLPEDTFPPYIVYYTDDEGLVRLKPPVGSLVEIGKAKALIHHASLFAVVAQLAPPPRPLPAKFEVSNLTISPSQAQLAQPIVISLTITNDGATAGSYEFHVRIDGIIRIVKEVTLAGKSSQTLSFEISNLAAGKHQVKVAGLTGQFRVVSVAALPAKSTINWLVIDLSAVAVVVAGLLVLYLVTRRSRRLQLRETIVIDETEITDRLTRKWKNNHPEDRGQS